MVFRLGQGRMGVIQQNHVTKGTDLASALARYFLEVCKVQKLLNKCKKQMPIICHCICLLCGIPCLLGTNPMPPWWIPSKDHHPTSWTSDHWNMLRELSFNRNVSQNSLSFI